MDGLKPVVPGCKVMYIGADPGQWGVTGTALRYVNDGESDEDSFGRWKFPDGGWMVEWDSLFRQTAPGFGNGEFGRVLCMKEKAIMRIDGDVDEESDCDAISYKNPNEKSTVAVWPKELAWEK